MNMLEELLFKTSSFFYQCKAFNLGVNLLHQILILYFFFKRHCFILRTCLKNTFMKVEILLFKLGHSYLAAALIMSKILTY